ncbi:MAG: helix-turn-helix domain-containing protein [Clostridiales Family XIII bacterium]|jgi:transcriptional regulator with XRE-family HTH domain|nr:helix-turn-helix domain-containing protein [Clostridiales Family XIII bacterium]
MDINDTILALIEKSPDAITTRLAQRVRTRRLEMNLTQLALATRAGLSYATYRRFETTGEISLHNLVMIALALGTSDDFSVLFATRKYESIEQIVREKKDSLRQRGRQNE